MGTFLTYRLGGGEAGLRGFLDQFGPALRWPMTRLRDVPELTDGFVERLAAQSDEQAAGRPLAELERLRDDCLVAILRALREHEVGAGAVLARWERDLQDR
jgi:carnitine 3-dehydrogenase